MINDTIYVTGITPEGLILVGGIWRLYRQEGFPVDITLIILKEKGLLPDIMELFAEATYHAELPQVKKQVPELFTLENIDRWMIYLKSKCLEASNQFDIAEQILIEKRQNGITPKNYGKMIVYCLELQKQLAERKNYE